MGSGGKFQESRNKTPVVTGMEHKKLINLITSLHFRRIYDHLISFMQQFISGVRDCASIMSLSKWHRYGKPMKTPVCRFVSHGNP